MGCYAHMKHALAERVLVPVSDLVELIKKDQKTKDQFQEAHRNHQLLDGRDFKPKSTADGVMLLLGRKRKATILTEAQYPDAFDGEKPKVRSTKKIMSLQAPILGRPGEFEKVF